MIPLVFAFQRLYRCDIDSADSCEVAYAKYVTCYNKEPSEKSMQIFCEKFAHLKSIEQSCPECNVNGALDKNVPIGGVTHLERRPMLKRWSVLSKLRNMLSVSNASRPNVPEDCYSGYLCGLKDPYTVLDYVYKSVHLEEAGLVTPVKNQATCGSCWAFATTCQLENAILNMNRNNLSGFWLEYINNTLDLSEIWAAADISGMNQGCSGGDSSNALNWFLAFADSVELESNYKYSDYVNYYNKSPTLSYLPYKINTSEYLQPLKSFEASGDEYAVIALNFDYDGTNDDIIKQMKSYLSRGMALTADMYADNDQIQFYDYNHIPHMNCDPSKIDHAVNIVGYGKKNGKDVWVVRNSWGQDWGANGYLYLEMGRNSFCIETVNVVTIPKDYNPNVGLHSNIGSHTRGQSWQLDPDDGEIVANDGNYVGNNDVIIIVATVVTLVVIGIIGAVIYFAYCRSSKKDVTVEYPILETDSAYYQTYQTVTGPYWQ